MLDAGLTLEPERLALVQKIKERGPEECSQADLAAYRAGMNPDALPPELKEMMGGGSLPKMPTSLPGLGGGLPGLGGTPFKGLPGLGRKK